MRPNVPRRLLVAVLVAALAGVLPTAATAAPGKTTVPGVTCDAKKAKKQHKKGKRGKRGKRSTTCAPPAPATPVAVQLLEGSHAVVDVPAVPLPGGYVLPGTPAKVTVPISGELKGAIPGGYQLGKDNTLALTSAAITPAPVDILNDAGCGGAPVLRLNPATNVVLDKAQRSSGTIFASGKVTADVKVLLNLAFDARQGTACSDPLVPMGSSPTALPVSVNGVVSKETGLAKLALSGPPAWVTAGVCLAPGAPGAACATPPAGYPVSIAVDVVTSIKVG